MTVVNKFNVNKQQVTLDADIIENMSANDVSYDASTQYNENTVGDKLSKLSQQVIYDVTVNNDGVTFTSLTELLSSENLSTLIPTSVRHGGMSISFVQSSDNKYVQYRLMAQNFTTDVTQWQGVDDEPTAGSDNLVKSRGVVNDINLIKGQTLLSSGQYYRFINDGTPVILTKLETISSSKINVVQGNVFKLKTLGTGVAYDYYIVDENYIPLKYSNSFSGQVVTISITESNAKYLLVNCINSFSDFFCYLSDSNRGLSDSLIGITGQLDRVAKTSLNGNDFLQGFWKDGEKYTKVSLNSSDSYFSLKISIKNGETYVIYSPCTTSNTDSVSAAIVDEDMNILERFNNYYNEFKLTVNSASAKYLLLTCEKTYINYFYYYLDTKLVDRIKFNNNDYKDCFIYRPEDVSMSVTHVGQHTVYTFDQNPRVITLDKRIFYLFPEDSTEEDWSIKIDAYQIVYIEADVIESSTTWLEPFYLPVDSIKHINITGQMSVLTKNCIIIAISREYGNSNNWTKYGFIYDIGCIGHDYFSKLTLSIPTIENRVSEIENNVATGVRSVFPPRKSYNDVLKTKCPKFYSAMKKKNKDVTIVLTGTSLSQGNLYASDKDNPTEYPPLLHTHDLAGTLFDILINNWDGQKYRRYDHTDLTYSESTWEITNDCISNDSHIWDDENSDKNGKTKTTTSTNASVSFIIPEDAWQFNFIYRSDSEGGDCTISIQEGNQMVEVWNGVEWVEANGYVFSMLESPETPTKGNTCYQKRLKMRCKNKISGGINSIGTIKNVTISKGDNSSRFNVVGLEWSPREFMFTFINGARGSHQWGVGDRDGKNLEYFQDSDIWEFKPDLILMETTVINWGGSSVSALKTDPLYYVNCAKRAYFNEFSDNADSIYEKSNHYKNCEIIFYGDTLSGATVYDNCWDDNGDAAFSTVTSAATNGNEVSTENVGRVKNNFENYDAVDEYMKTKTDYIFIPVTRTFKEVCESYWGHYRLGFVGSGKTGDSLSTDTTHLNDNGAALWASLISPLFEF